jgi:hypothetical protein
VLVLQSAESKKEEFQKYLEKSGVIDALTKGRRDEKERAEIGQMLIRGCVPLVCSVGGSVRSP